MSLIIMSCGGNHKTKTVQTSKEKVSVPKKEVYIIKKDAVKDIDGNSYNSVVINGREWMTSNLRVTRFNDSTPIIQVKNEKELDKYLWDKNYSYVNYDSLLVTDYGLYYNYETVKTEKLCPDGWHVASKEDWSDGLMIFVLNKGDNTAKNYYPERDLRSKTDWYYSDMNGNDKYKLNILPSGIRDETGKIVDFGKAAGFWTSTSDGNGNRACMFNTGGGMGIRVLDGRYGQAVRCVKDRKKSE
ncbi:fibrobacter succinogenes major paralogous domain-containing protein [Labilibaculum filiforme]|uniref:fibrobacter succinogenes major paralogous domain-containing protein n=1 Tax=Labilibaculum filiforme TaxID=1940526 RepID=UPI0015D6430B|nr:fibrobacter succinogenes major paralogous domain-containing protein [Labilibaculum filiforme]